MNFQKIAYPISKKSNIIKYSFTSFESLKKFAQNIKYIKDISITRLMLQF